ncbi:DEAD/DEAH box helicase [Tuberibacillus sp. Marseille-P3662]|uniref:DEAD/DEAH box helicase n=1 Tax=Tuberibacillus sp. Marseille-P3662 TaxID=1965358 RepID=UPI000A1CC404|nr:DEAD/DEAH box helicase [Tuberibacillus sp. Marseille-P3662]
MVLFSQLNLHEPLLKAVSQMGYEEMTSIQEEAIPPGLERQDIIGQAQTGTGKTAAFGIPLIQNLQTESRNAQGVVLAPTRELAIQVADELNKIGRVKGIRTLAVYGGQDIDRQIKALKRRPQIIVGTPGRFMDHMRRKTIRLDDVSTVVLDEADEMLSMGFIEDIETILGAIPTQHHTMLFSATMPKQLQNIAEKFMHQPKVIAVKAQELTVTNIEQHYYVIKEREKFDTLTRLFDIYTPELAIIFGRTKRRVDELTEALTKRGFNVEGIHGDLRQKQRDRVLTQFRRGTIDILVATDVAARGLDISGVTHVINFDIPQDPESYVHRIGRTGRAGKSGWAFTFVTPPEMDHLRKIEGMTKKQLSKQPKPSEAEALQGRQQHAIQQLLDVVNDGSQSKHQGKAEELLKEHTAVDLVSAALKALTKEPSQTPVEITDIPPVSVKRDRGGGGSRQRNNRNKGGGRPHNKGRGYQKGRNNNYKSSNRRGGQHKNRRQQRND